MSTDEQYMNRCIQLARLGEGYVAPNPMVGAVIVHDGKIIGEGYHQRFGETHAEVNAVRSVEDPSVLKESTIYVSLEPCAHHGKTPPCADLIAAKGFKRVVIGARDPHSKVDGKGIQIIHNAGIETEIGVLEKECRELNKRFYTYHEKHRPFIVLKWAQTPNGFIDQGEKNRQVDWISQPEMQTIVHKWRSENQAILVGRKTVENDNPSLTVRAVEGNNPIRVVLDAQLILQADAKVFNDEAKTIVLNTKEVREDGNVSYVKLDSLTSKNISQYLFDAGIQSLFIEGGATTLQSFIDEGLWDEAHVIIGQHDFQSGTKAPVLSGTPRWSEKKFGDTINHYMNT